MNKRIVCQDTNEIVYNYKEYQKTKHWESLKNEFYFSNECKCVLCDSVKKVSLHHKTYRRIGAEELDDLIPLCNSCHYKVHRNNKQYLFNDATEKQIRYINDLLEVYVDIVEELFMNEYIYLYVAMGIGFYNKNLMLFEANHIINDLKFVSAMLYEFYATKLEIKLPGYFNEFDYEEIKDSLYKKMQRLSKYIYVPKKQEIELLFKKRKKEHYE
ncbi:HNH endonuclease signature motif containing protein [Clostridioides difficile]|uniref:HNH endonuclease signature motif containing protein n=1 Tax=Clostridioides difficile TaxID=1496 RepID=UPI001A8D07FF|nr:HNH endonuclease signature motif containing protein [Clostridioides difficile]